MHVRTLLLAALVLPLVAPLAPEAAAWRCVPAQDTDALRLSANGDTYYVRRYGSLSASIQELWEETNGEPGLQLTKGMSCVGKPDAFLRSVCTGICPIQL